MSGGQGSGRNSLEQFRHVALAEAVSTNSECLLRAREG
ncbi:biotin--[acetyl-CoA-carboxylase] ligase, partial [Sinorhizobium medicae]